MSKVYKAYRFTDKDPIIPEMKTLVMDCYGVSRVTHKELRDMENNGGPSTAAMRNWFFGETKRPSNSSIEAAGRSMGFMRKWVKERR